jgi:uncharacterized protein YyaL (SSP411 family)
MGDRGNFEGRTILHVPESRADAARRFGLSPESLAAVLSESRELLYRERKRRPPPVRDGKILTAWNGLAISAFARAGFVLDDPGCVRRAAGAARFLLDSRGRDGRLCRTCTGGEGKNDAFLEDYACLIAGLLDLYEADGDPDWLAAATGLDGLLEKHYEDAAHGGYFLTADDREDLLVREKPSYDGAEPSGNSVEALNLLRLCEFTGKEGYRRRAEGIFRSLESTWRSNPVALSEMLLAVDYYLDRPVQILIVAPRGKRDGASPLLAALRGRFVPNRVLSVTTEGEERDRASSLVPLLEGKPAEGGRATAYVCRNRTCRLPTADPDEFARQLESDGPPPDGSGG